VLQYRDNVNMIQLRIFCCPTLCLKVYRLMLLVLCVSLCGLKSRIQRKCSRTGCGGDYLEQREVSGVGENCMVNNLVV
jgi:hypothetical protein